MKVGSHWLALLLAAWVAAPPAIEPPTNGRLAVWADGAWRPFWTAGEAPARWSAAHPALAGATAWIPVADGIEQAELRLSGSGSAWRLRVVLVRIDPSRVDMRLQRAVRSGGTLGAWTVDSLAVDARVALNAGQFTGGRPWGWVVEGGVELQAPQRAPLAVALVADSSGAIRLVEDAELDAARAAGGVAAAFQSYPAVLMGEGEVPSQLRAPGRGVDLEHRDSRLAIGALRDGRLLVALTRFDALGGALDVVPFGPTTPEMAALMGALGCRRAVLLDGGLSSQLALRGADGTVRQWPGARRVPLGLLVTLRTGAARLR